MCLIIKLQHKWTLALRGSLLFCRKNWWSYHSWETRSWMLCILNQCSSTSDGLLQKMFESFQEYPSAVIVTRARSPFWSTSIIEHIAVQQRNQSFCPQWLCWTWYKAKRICLYIIYIPLICLHQQTPWQCNLGSHLSPCKDFPRTTALNCPPLTL